ncbi:MAG: hypothetical protein GHCLOJNM_03016 [bacterium]|nr:hypothetical protein [bacterium]
MKTISTPWSRRTWVFATFVAVALSSPVHGVDCSNDERLVGTIQGINVALGEVTVGGVVYGNDGDTEYRDGLGNSVEFSFFQLGDLVEIEFCPDSGPPPILLKMKIEDEGTGEDNAKFTGTIESIDGAAKSLIVNGTLVHTTTATVFLDHVELPIVFGDLSVGDPVEVEGTRLPDNSVQAIKVKKEDIPGSELEFKGTIESINEAAMSLIVNGTLVRTTTATVFLDHVELPIVFGDLSVGDPVEVEGTRLPDNSVQAIKVKKEDLDDDECEAEFKGAIVEIDSVSLTLLVGLVRIRTNETTFFSDHEGAPIGFDDLHIGDFVEVKYCPTSGVPPLASEVKKEDGGEDSPEGEVKVEGALESIFPASSELVVAGVLIRAENARIRDDSGNPIPLDLLSPGDFLEVEGFLLADGSVRARSIQVEDPESGDCESKARGFLTAVDPIAMRISVGIVEIAVATSTEIFDDETGLPLTLEELVVGQAAEVEYCAVTGIPTATKIEIKRAEDHDLNQDGSVRGDDIVIFLDHRQRGGVTLDLDGDSRTTHNDLILLTGSWGQTGP